jgi:hypothetical protein
MAPSGIEPAAFRLVEQCINQLRHHVTLHKKVKENRQQNSAASYFMVWVMQGHKWNQMLGLYEHMELAKSQNRQDRTGSHFNSIILFSSEIR